MVDAQVAGVLFTADPVTGRRTRAVIDASPGLGEAVVSGMVNPDHFVVEDGRVVDRRLGDKAVAVRALPGGGTERVELRRRPTTRRGTATVDACITDAQAVALAALGRRVEAHFGAPQDIEWAIDDAGTIWLTQARPITTLYPVPPSRDGALPRVRLRQPGPGADPADHADGPGRLRRHRRLPGAAVRPPRPAPTDLVAPPPAFAAVGGTRVRRRHGRAAQPARAGRRAPRPRYHGGASGVVLRDLFADPAFARCPGARRRALRRIVPVLVRLRVPLVVAQAIASPTGRPPPRRPHRRPRRRRSRLPAGRHPGRAGGSRDRGARDGRGGVPPQRTGLRGRLPHAGGRAPAGRDGPGRRHDGRRAARAAAQRHHRDGPGAVGAGAAGARGPGVGRRTGRRRRRRAGLGALAARYHAGALPAVLQDGLAGVPAPLRPPGRRRDRPRHAPLVRGARPRARRRSPTTCGSQDGPGRRTRRPVRRRRAGGGAGARATSSPGSGGAPGGARGPSGSPSAGCARWSGCARPPRTTSSG